jgi:hypothetical protein
MSRLLTARRRAIGASIPNPGGGGVITPPDPGAGFLRASNLATWGGSFPTARAPLTLTGMNILFDIEMQDSDAWGTLTLPYGAQFAFDPAVNTRLLADSIIISGGRMFAGTSSLAHQSKLQIDICGAMPTVSGNPGGGALVRGYTHDPDTDAPTGNNGLANDGFGMTRALMVSDGGILNLYGKTPPTIARLSASYSTGTVLQVTPLDRDIPAGALVCVTPDGFYNAARRTERRRTTVFAPAGSTALYLNSALTYPRFGRFQYYTDNGVSLTPGAWTVKSSSNPNGKRSSLEQDPIVGQPAFVYIFDQNIQIQGYDLPGMNGLANRYGFHGMGMQNYSEWVIKNVGMQNAGQGGLKARYPWHTHLTAFNPDGTPKLTGFNGTNRHNPDKALLDGVGMIDCFNRAESKHACHGTKTTNVVAIGVKGAAFFEENGAEMYNEFSNCHAVGVDDPGDGWRLKLHDSLSNGLQPLAAFWFANPNNTHIENWAVDCQGGAFANSHTVGLFGRQASPQYGCLDESANVPIAPAFERNGRWFRNRGLACDGFSWSNNQIYTNAGRGRNFDRKLSVTLDGVAPAQINGSSSTSLPNTDPAGFKVERMELYFCGHYDRVVDDPNYTFQKQVDILTNAGVGGKTTTGNIGTTRIGRMRNALWIRRSLNPESALIDTHTTFPAVSYHGSQNETGSVRDGWQGAFYSVDGGNHGSIQKTAGLPTWDSYVQSILVYLIGFKDLILRNTDAIFQSPPSHLSEQTTTYDFITGTTASGGKYVQDPIQGGRQWSLGILFDPYGTFGSGPTTPGTPNSHIVWNQPFFTIGAANPVQLENNPQSVSTTTAYIGMQTKSESGPYNRYTARTKLQRCTSAGALIDGAVWDMPALTNSVLGFHPTSLPQGGFARVTWPDLPKPTNGEIITITLENAGHSIPDNDVGTTESEIELIQQRKYINPNYDKNKKTTWGFDWDQPTVEFSCSYRPNDSPFFIVIGVVYKTDPSITSLATLNAAPVDKDYIWLDTANKVAWVRVGDHYNFAGGLLRPATS